MEFFNEKTKCNRRHFCCESEIKQEIKGRRKFYDSVFGVVKVQIMDKGKEIQEENMALFMTRKKREQIGDEIDDLLMRQYHHRCKLEEAQLAGDEEKIKFEEEKIQEKEEQIQKLRRKLA